jgi:hypothetical protein
LEPGPSLIPKPMFVCLFFKPSHVSMCMHVCLCVYVLMFLITTWNCFLAGMPLAPAASIHQGELQMHCRLAVPDLIVNLVEPLHPWSITVAPPSWGCGPTLHICTFYPVLCHWHTQNNSVQYQSFLPTTLTGAGRVMPFWLILEALPSLLSLICATSSASPLALLQPRLTFQLCTLV